MRTGFPTPLMPPNPDRVRLGNAKTKLSGAALVQAEVDACTKPDETFAQSAFFPPQIPDIQPQPRGNRPKRGVAKLFERIKSAFDPRKGLKPLEKDLVSLADQLIEKKKTGQIDLCLDKPIRHGEKKCSNGRVYPTKIKDIRIGGKDYEFVRQDGRLEDDWHMDSYVLRSVADKLELELCDIGKNLSYANNSADFTFDSKSQYVCRQGKRFFYPMWDAIQEGAAHQQEHQQIKKAKEVGGIRI